MSFDTKKNQRPWAFLSISIDLLPCPNLVKLSLLIRGHANTHNSMIVCARLFGQVPKSEHTRYYHKSGAEVGRGWGGVESGKGWEGVGMLYEVAQQYILLHI